MLEKINNPKDLKQLNLSELNELADDFKISFNESFK